MRFLAEFFKIPLLDLFGCGSIAITGADMDMDLITKAQAELQQVEMQLQALKRRQDELRMFIAIGRSLTGREQGTTTVSRDMTVRWSLDGRAAQGRRYPLKQIISDAVEKLLKTNGGPMHTRDLVDRLTADGIEIGGSDKAVTVSVILSRDTRFVSDRKYGWRLAAEDGNLKYSDSKEEAPRDAGTSAGLDLL